MKRFYVRLWTVIFKLAWFTLILPTSIKKNLYIYIKNLAEAISKISCAYEIFLRAFKFNDTELEQNLTISYFCFWNTIVQQANQELSLLIKIKNVTVLNTKL